MDTVVEKVAVQEEEPGHVMRIIDRTGDTKLIWDEDVEVEVENARKTFNRLKKQGYNAYAVKKNGDAGKVITEFDPEAGKIILAPPMAGG